MITFIPPQDRPYYLKLAKAGKLPPNSTFDGVYLATNPQTLDDNSPIPIINLRGDYGQKTTTNKRV